MSSNTSTIQALAILQVAAESRQHLQDQAGANPDFAVGSVRYNAPACLLRELPDRLTRDASRTAVGVNPSNAPTLALLAQQGLSFPGVPDPARISVLTTKYWNSAPRRFTVSFMEPLPTDLRQRILEYMNAWSPSICHSFSYTAGAGDVRVSRANAGYWSYLGTDILHVPPKYPTMNLSGFTMNTRDSEYARVIPHEVGHTLGFPHEHMRKALVSRIDPLKAYAYFARTQGWDRTMVDEQVLKSLDEADLLGTPPDQTSIMCYQLPGSITRDGLPILGGTVINSTDFAFAGSLYPRRPVPPIARSGASKCAIADQGSPAAAQWDASEDVTVNV